MIRLMPPFPLQQGVCSCKNTHHHLPDRDPGRKILYHVSLHALLPRLEPTSYYHSLYVRVLRCPPDKEAKPKSAHPPSLVICPGRHHGEMLAHTASRPGWAPGSGRPPPSPPKDKTTWRHMTDRTLARSSTLRYDTRRDCSLTIRVQCPVSSVQCPVSNVQCPVSNVQCLVSSVHSSPTMPRGGTRNCIRSCASASLSPRAVHVHYRTYKDLSLLVLCQGRPAAYLADIGCGALLIMMDESLSPLLEE
jgi:hypothetical protein